MANEGSIWSRVLAFFAEKPIFGVLGSLCSIAAIPLALWFSIKAIKAPRLTFSVQPGRLEVVRAGQSSGISVRYKGHPVLGDVSVAKVALWNAGDAPIRERDDVRKAVVIFTKPSVPILRASIVRAAPAEARVTIDPAQLEHGRVPVHWDVLAKREGAVFEILYNGPPDVSLGVEGSILGQLEIVKYKNNIGYDSPEEEYKDLQEVNERWRFVTPFFVIGSFIGSGVASFFAMREKDDRLKRKLLIIVAVLALSFTVLTLTIYHMTPPPEPQAGGHVTGPGAQKNTG